MSIGTKDMVGSAGNKNRKRALHHGEGTSRQGNWKKRKLSVVKGRQRNSKSWGAVVTPSLEIISDWLIVMTRRKTTLL